MMGYGLEQKLVLYDQVEPMLELEESSGGDKYKCLEQGEIQVV